MKGKNYKLMGMKAMAVFSILSMTVFSFSYNVAYAYEFGGNQDRAESHNQDYTDDQKHEDSNWSDDKSDSMKSKYKDSEYKDKSEDDESNHEDKDHDSKDKDFDNPSKNKKDHDKDHDKDSKDHNKVTICHATNSETNPYVKITISVSSIESHKNHQGREDIIPAPNDGCPQADDNGGHNDDDSNHHEDDSDNDGHHDDDEDDDNDCDRHNHKYDANCGTENTAPIITLNGSSTVIVFVGDSYIDLGASANDKEDGDITSHIVTASNVDSSTVGTYTVTYNVKDSKGLCASTVTRTVIVKPRDEKNNAPVITLLGLNPVTITQGDIYLDPGATAYDIEDGDITPNIVKTGSVDTSIVGTYTISYNVKDSKGLAAETVTRTVNVVPVQTGANKGKITFCLILADSQNVVATSSYALPEGSFVMSLGTTTGVATTTLFTKNWNANSFTPNQKAILGQNDSDCITYGNLDFGTYNYSEMSVNGSTWNTPKYNDQNSQPVNNVFDFLPFDINNDNSDGVIIINGDRPERTLYVYNTYKAGPSCELPVITSSLATSATVNQNFSIALNASSTSQVSWDVATTSLPVGVTFATTTNTISGTPTTAGTYSVALKAANTCGFTDKTLVITVSDGTTGGGGSPTINLAIAKVANRGAANVGDEVQYTITLENRGPETATNVKVTDVLPAQLDFKSASTSVGAYATSTGIWTIGTLANGSTTSLVLIVSVKSGTEGQNIANTATTSGDQSDSDTSNNTSTANVSVLNPNTNGGGGGGGTTGGGGGGGSNGPIVGSYGGGGSTGGQVLSGGISELPIVQGCNYLLDYLRKDFNNNPYEVTKLQLFLKNLEGFTDLKVTGIYDQATIDAVNVFQIRYKGDVLTPWGHTAPTSFVYILTKKKVNEIYCKMAFPVTSAQQEEIDNYRNSHSFGNSGQGPVVTNNEVGYGNGNSVVLNPKDVIVANATSTTKTATSTAETVANIGLTTLAGFSSTTKGAASEFVANIISSGKRIGSLLGALFAIPGMLFAGMNKNSCTTSSNVMSGLNLILLIVIALLSYFWYRERKNNKTIEEINKEIDLK